MENEEKKPAYNQDKNIDFIKNELGLSLWVQVCGFLPNTNDCFIFAFLIRNGKDKEFLDDVGGNLNFVENAGFTMYGSDETQYGFNNDELVDYFVRERSFNGIEQDFYELSDEFLLVFNAFKKDDEYICVKNDGNIDIIAKILDNKGIIVNRLYLNRFMAAKQMSLGFVYDFRVNSNVKFDDTLKENFNFRDETINFEFYSGDLQIGNHRYFTRLNGRKIISCNSKEESYIWPFESDKQYVKFKIGYDKKCKIIEYTCDPSMLKNNFGANPNAPHYLTPIAFKKEVLKKYIDHPDKYKVTVDHIFCGSLWGIEIDAEHDDILFAYLGDLGRDLPESEYQHWLSFNVITNEKLSSTTIARDFGGIFANSESLDEIFKSEFALCNSLWEEKYSFQLFKILSESDKYCYQKAIMPVLNEQHEFDDLCLMLSKITIDSIDIKKIKELETMDSNKKTLETLELFLKNRFDDSQTIEIIIQNLRNVQSLRSEQAGHVKGSGLDKLYSRIGIKEYIDSKNYIECSKYVFNLLIDSLKRISKLLKTV